MGNNVHATAVVGPGVVLGAGNVIGPYAVLYGPLRLGDRNWVGPHAVLGSPAQIRGGPHPAPQDAPPASGVLIRDDNVLREFVTVQQPSSGRTVIGSRCYLMTQSHVPHDAELGDGVTMANSVQLGGHTRVGDDATVGLGSVVHQRTLIGPGAMVGMGAVVTKDVPPYALAVGSPARVRGVNRVGMMRLGVPEESIEWLTGRYERAALDVRAADVTGSLQAAFAWWDEQRAADAGR